MPSWSAPRSTRRPFSGKDAASRATVLRHFHSITVENAMKAAPLNPRPGVWNFGPADAFVAFGEAHGMFIVGHTLVWHNQTPAWFFQNERGEANSPKAQVERMRSHIEVVAGRYKGRVHAWDVWSSSTPSVAAAGVRNQGVSS